MKLFYVTYRLRRINRLKKYWWGRLLQRLGVVGDRLVVRVFGENRILEHCHPRNTVWQRWAIEQIKPRYAAAHRHALGITGERTD